MQGWCRYWKLELSCWPVSGRGAQSEGVKGYMGNAPGLPLECQTQSTALSRGALLEGGWPP
jgi:hypothetical protein